MSRKYSFKIFFIGLVIISLIGVINIYSSSIQAETATQSMFFEFDKETGTITDFDSTGPENVVIPSEIEGTKVKKIGVEAFLNTFLNYNIESVEIPDSVEEIGYLAFDDDVELIWLGKEN